MLLANSRERWLAVLLAVIVGITLAFGFLPAVGGLFDWIWPHLELSYRAGHQRSVVRMLSFPVVAGFFFLSLPRTIASPPIPFFKTGALWRISVLPWLIAAGFGYWVNKFPLIDIELVWWQMVLAPVGEELLFRGWFYELSERVFKKKMFTATNTLPVAVWTSAIAFSLWHLQNHLPGSYASSNFTLFQVGYTLVAGFWLGYLRWKSQSVVFPILAHVVLNALGGALWLYLGT